MLTNDQIYPTLEDSRQVAPILARLGIEADAAWYKCYADDTWKLIQIDSYGGFMLLGDKAVINSYALWSAQDKVTEFLPAYRLDKLMLCLPEWCFSACYWSNGQGQFGFGQERSSPPFSWDNDCHKRIKALVNEFTFRQGSEALKAVCELLVLLDKENLLEVKR